MSLVDIINGRLNGPSGGVLTAEESASLVRLLERDDGHRRLRIKAFRKLELVDWPGGERDVPSDLLRVLWMVEGQEHLGYITEELAEQLCLQVSGRGYIARVHALLRACVLSDAEARDLEYVIRARTRHDATPTMDTV